MREPKKCFPYPVSPFLKGKLRGIKLNNSPDFLFFKGRQDFFGSLKMEDKYRLFVDVEKPLELVSLSGWIAPLSEGNLNIHAHFLATTVVDDKIVSLGGHLTKGTITSIKVVVVIGAIEDTNINAALDPTINQVNLDFGDKYHSLHDFNK
jgi:hypothetical protein